MSADVFKPVNERLSGERELRDWAYEQRVEELEEGVRDDLYDTVVDHSQNIADNIRRAREVF